MLPGLEHIQWEPSREIRWPRLSPSTCVLISIQLLLKHGTTQRFSYWDIHSERFLWSRRNYVMRIPATVMRPFSASYLPAWPDFRNWWWGLHDNDAHRHWPLDPCHQADTDHGKVRWSSGTHCNIVTGDQALFIVWPDVTATSSQTIGLGQFPVLRREMLLLITHKLIDLLTRFSPSRFLLGLARKSFFRQSFWLGFLGRHFCWGLRLVNSHK